MQSSQHSTSDADAPKLRSAKVVVALRLLGANEYDVWLPETHYLMRMLHGDEVLLGVVFGKFEEKGESHVSRGLLAVTDREILLLNKKPLYVHHEHIKFDMVSGVEYKRVAFTEIITLNTRLGDITFRTFNSHCARQFVQVIDDILCAQGRGWGIA